MCDVIVINQGEKQIETPQQFKNHFGYMPQIDKAYNQLDIDSCLCQCDIDKTFKSRAIQFSREYDNNAGDYYLNPKHHEAPTI